MEDGGYFRRIGGSLLFKGQRLKLNAAHRHRLPPTSGPLAEDPELKHVGQDIFPFSDSTIFPPGCASTLCCFFQKHASPADSFPPHMERGGSREAAQPPHQRHSLDETLIKTRRRCSRSHPRLLFLKYVDVRFPGS